MSFKSEMARIHEKLDHVEMDVKRELPNTLHTLFKDVVAELQREGDVPLLNLMRGINDLASHDARMKALAELESALKAGVKQAVVAEVSRAVARLAIHDRPAQPDPKEAVHQ